MRILIAAFLGISLNATAQSDADIRSAELDRSISEYMASKMIEGAQLGYMLCEDAQGKRVICSGDISETALGVITSVPYVTVNKPQHPGDSHHVFEAHVSVSNGQIEAGDYLKPVADGRLGKCEADEIPFAFGMALQSAKTDSRIRVKVLKR